MAIIEDGHGNVKMTKYEEFVKKNAALKKGIPQNLSEEEQMRVNVSFEGYRKALIRASQDNKRLIEVAGKSIYILERVCLDNIINRAISTPIAVAETKEELIDFCHLMYGDYIPFNDNGNTPTIQIPMGEASFQIKTVAHLENQLTENPHEKCK